MNIKVSVIIPVYNSESSIVATLESVRLQTYKFFEIIIVNDGSKDKSLQIINDYIITHLNLDIKVISQVNQGVSTARNRGLAVATGDWIALLDSDDKWMPHKLQRQLQIINENSNIDFLGANRKGEHYNSFFNIKFDLVTKITEKNLLFKNFFATSTVIFKKEIINEIGNFDVKQNYCEDANYFIKIAQKKGSYLLNESLVATGEGETHFQEKGLSSNLWEMEKGEIININYAFKSKIVTFGEYIFLYNYSIFKYIRRFIIVKKMNLIANIKSKK